MNLESFCESCVYEISIDEDRVRAYASGQTEMIKLDDLRGDTMASGGTPTNKSNKYDGSQAATSIWGGRNEGT